MAGDPDITELLRRAAQGDDTSLSEVAPIVYDQLRGLAGSFLRAQPASHTLRTTALVNEAYLKLVGGEPVDWQGRAHFFGVAARAMRSILVDHARARGRAKRGGGARRIALDDALAMLDERNIDLLELDDALAKLASFDERKARTVELLFFAGLPVDHAAHVLGVSPSTVDRDWKLARAWLRREMSAGDPVPDEEETGR